MRTMFNEVISGVLHSSLHRMSVQSLLHNQLHRTHPPQPKHPAFSLAVELHPAENTRRAKPDSCCGTEGRGFKSHRSPQTFR